jgi:hypothetical protein
MGLLQFITSPTGLLQFITSLVQIGVLLIALRAANNALKTARSLNYSQLWDTEFKVDDIFIERPHLRKYFYEGTPLKPTDPHYAEAEAVAEKLLDVMEHLVWQPELFPDLYLHWKGPGKIKWKMWKRYIVDTLASSPLLRDYLKKRKSWYVPELHRLAEEAERNLER